MKRLVFISTLFWAFSTANAQENPILGRWDASLTDSEVLLEWTIISGSTCQGIKIYRSQNGLDFIQIGHIPGVCGSISEPVDYIWKDAEPFELATNYYRLEFGVQGFSSINIVEVEGLVQRSSLVFPNPATSDATLVFQTSGNEEQEVLIFNATGSLVYQENVSGSDRITINAGLLAPGTYIYSLRSDTRSDSGRFIIL